MKNSSVKVGVITDQTGPLSFMGIANANVAKMVIHDINANGGLLGKKIDLYPVNLACSLPHRHGWNRRNP